MAEQKLASDEIEKMLRETGVGVRTSGSTASALRYIDENFGDDSSSQSSASKKSEESEESSPRVRESTRDTEPSAGAKWAEFSRTQRREAIRTEGPRRIPAGPTVNKILRELEINDTDTANSVLTRFASTLSTEEEKGGIIDANVNFLSGLIHSYLSVPEANDLIQYIYEIIIEARQDALHDIDRTDNILAGIIEAKRRLINDKLNIITSKKQRPVGGVNLDLIRKNAEIIRRKKQAEELKRVEQQRRQALEKSFIRRAATLAKAKVTGSSPSKEETKADIPSVLPIIPEVVSQHEPPRDRGLLYALILNVTREQAREAQHAEGAREVAQGKAVPTLPGSVIDQGRYIEIEEAKSRRKCEKCEEFGVYTYDGKKRVCRCLKHLAKLRI